jgi:hypothetical protein
MSADVPNRANDSNRAAFGTYGAQHPLSYQTAPLPETPAVERNSTASTLRNGGYQHTGFEAGAL